MIYYVLIPSYRWMRGIPLKGKYYVYCIYICIKSIYLILIDGGRIVLLRDISDWTHDLLYTMHHYSFKIFKFVVFLFFLNFSITYFCQFAASKINWITYLYRISYGLSFLNIYKHLKYHILKYNGMFSELRKTFLSTYICKNLVASPLNWINV